MLLRYPAYYDQFRCIAAACPDSCCKEWDVLIDAQSAEAYRQMPGELGDSLRAHIKQSDGEWFFEITKGRCPMWRDDGLCRIQAACGHDALCQTCRQFPRLTHDYGDFMELGLELSCPEAARIIFSAESGWIQQETEGGEAPQYDAHDMAILLRTRNVMLTILADESRPVSETLALALLYGYRAQDELDGADPIPFDPEAELAFGRSMAKPANRDAILDFYKNLEILTATWREMLENPRQAPCWDPALRILARYGVERYWLQAISDFDLVGRVKMVILSCILVYILGGKVPETSQIYGKEIENSIENVEAILDGVYTCPALTDDKLLGLLL